MNGGNGNDGEILGDSDNDGKPDKDVNCKSVSNLIRKILMKIR